MNINEVGRSYQAPIIWMIWPSIDTKKTEISRQI